MNRKNARWLPSSMKSMGLTGEHQGENEQNSIFVKIRRCEDAPGKKALS